MIQESNNQFFDDLKEWSERKLHLLNKYLDSATRILSKFGQVYYIDGFAGRGHYGKLGQPKVLGSPLLAAKLAQECVDEKRAYSLYCINVESNPSNYNELTESTAPYGPLVTNYLGTFVNHVDQIVRSIRDKPVVCLLDPFGVDGMDWHAVRKLIRKQGVTDFWIRFDAGEVRRRDGWFGKPDLGAEKQFEILCKIYGTENREWLHEQLSAPSPTERKQKAIRLYLKLLTDEFTKIRGEGYAYAYRIGSLEGEEKYHLIGATSHRKGASLASNIVYGIEETYKREVERYKTLSSNGQLSMFDVLDPTEEQILATKVSEIERDMIRLYQGSTLSRLDVHIGLLDDWFGVIKGPHITKALKNLQKQGYVLKIEGQPSDDASMISFRKI